MASPSVYMAIFSSRAQKEVAESWNWYEDRQQGLGDRFLKEPADRVHSIEQAPKRYPTRFKTYRETPIPVFPFLIICRVSEKRKLVRILSIFHTSLNPKKKY
jgi:hypothetical protein